MAFTEETGVSDWIIIYDRRVGTGLELLQERGENHADWLQRVNGVGVAKRLALDLDFFQVFVTYPEQISIDDSILHLDLILLLLEHPTLLLQDNAVAYQLLARFHHPDMQCQRRTDLDIM